MSVVDIHPQAWKLQKKHRITNLCVLHFVHLKWAIMSMVSHICIQTWGTMHMRVLHVWQHITPPFKVTALRSAMPTTACSFFRTQPMPSVSSRTINQCACLGHLRSPTGRSFHTFYPYNALCANKLRLTTGDFGHRAILIWGIEMWLGD